MDVLHCDLNNFYASVEQVIDPMLCGKPVAVSGNAESRHGIILAKNYEARAFGVQTGEAIWQAKQKCPDLVCVLPHFEYYVHFSKRVQDIYLQYTDRIEPFGLDECWLDVTHSKFLGSPTEIANKIRQQIKTETGLTISVGVSFTKTFAKLGSDLKKPDAVTEISRTNYRKVAWNCKVGEMLFVGKKTEQALNAMGIVTIGDLANADATLLKRHFGVNGEKLKYSANGWDVEPVRLYYVDREIKSVGHGTTTLRDMLTYADAEKVLFYLCDMVATRLRRYGKRGNVVHLDVRRNDLSHESRQMAVNATFVANDIYNCAKKLLHSCWKATSDLPVRTLSVQVSGLQNVCEGVQMNMFADNTDEQLEFQIDKIRKKFGFNSIVRASYIGNDLLSQKLFSEEDLLPFKR